MPNIRPQRVANHLTAFIKVSAEGLRAEDITFDLRDEITEMAESFSLEKVKVFSSMTAKVLYSTSQEDLGTMNDKEYFHTIVLRGKNFTKLVQKNTPSHGRPHRTA